MDTFFENLAPLWCQVEGWNSFTGLVHGFSGRLRDRESTRSAELGVAEPNLATLKQVHGDEIVVVQRNSIPTERVEADGMITAEAGVLLGIATADCVPVLMVAPEQGLVAALHAGWRGTLKGICTRAVETLKTTWGVDSEELWVALGPAIDVCCYEVGSEVGEALHQRWKAPLAWYPKGKKGFLDLRAINATQCQRAGVPSAQVQRVGPCTFCAHPQFASYRREGANAGRQLSVIGWQRV
jgi:hypothetical protein